MANPAQEAQIAAAQAKLDAANATQQTAYTRYLQSAASTDASDMAQREKIAAQAAYTRTLSEQKLAQEAFATERAQILGIAQTSASRQSGGSTPTTTTDAPPPVGTVGASGMVFTGSAWTSPSNFSNSVRSGEIATPPGGFGYVGGAYDPKTGETTGGHPSEAKMAADRASAGVSPPSFAAPSQPTLLPESAPMAQQFNQMSVYLEAAKQPGATRASVQEAVSTYNQYSMQMYNPMEGDVIKAKYVPEGKYAQQERLRVKEGVAFDSFGRSTGEVAWYQEIGGGRKVRDVNTGELTTWMLIGGASRNAAQSGTIGFAAATPLVYEQGGVGTGKLTKAQVYAPGVLESGITADQILASIKDGTARDKFSGLGAEAYGGKVSRLDGRTLGTTTYEDVSNRAAWNLASYVNPTDVNLAKADLPGVSIPWSVPANSPAFFALTTEGGVGKPIAAKSFMANVRTEPIQEAPRNTLIIGGAEGARYGPSIVTAAPASDRLVGGGKVAAASTTITTPSSPAGVETAMAAGSVPKPFITGETTQPTGQIAIPFTDVKFTIPVVSDAIKFFESPTFTSARPTGQQVVKFSSERGAEATRMFINPETNKPTRELTLPVGEPRTVSTVNPETGVTETVTMQSYETTILPETKTYNIYESKQIRSGYEEFLDTNLRNRIPSVAAGEMAIGAAQLANPFNPTEKASDIIGRGITYKGAEVLGIDTKGARTTEEFVTSHVSPTKGQYEFFYEKPAASAVSYATMFVGGGVTRGIVSAIGRSERGAALIAKATPILNKYGGVVLTGLYGSAVSYEETKGFREVTPQTVASIKARGFQEGIPGAIGFGMGYNAPEIGSATYQGAARNVREVRAASTKPGQTSVGMKQLEDVPITQMTARSVVYESPVASKPAQPIPEARASPIIAEPVKPQGVATDAIRADGRPTKAWEKIARTEPSKEPVPLVYNRGTLESTAIDKPSYGGGGMSGEREIVKGGMEKEKVKLTEFEIRAKERELIRLENEKERLAYETQKQKIVEKQAPEKVKEVQTEKQRLEQISKERYGLVELGRLKTSEILSLREREATRQKEIGREKLQEKTIGGERLQLKEVVGVRQMELVKERGTIRQRENILQTEKSRVVENVRTRETVKQIETPREIERVTTPKPPFTPVTPVPIPLGMPGASAAGSQSLGPRFRVSTERFQVGSGIGWINIKAPGRGAPKAPKQTAPAKPARSPSAGKTPSIRPLPPPTSKKPRKLKF